MITSKASDYDPEVILKQLRKHNMNHLCYDYSLYWKTKKRLQGIIKSISNPTLEQKKAIHFIGDLSNFKAHGNKKIQDKK